MKNWAMILGLAAAMMLAACEQREQSGVATQPRAEREGQVAGEPARQPATSDQQTTGQQPADRDTFATPTTPPPQRDTVGQQNSMQGIQTDSQTAGSPAQGTRDGQAATGSRESSEFFGQGPQFGNAPETIVLKAANGNVTLSHKKHAGMTDCKACHGDGTPGPIEGFNKDQAHSLCTGCHKEKGAGPTKCQECHKKQ